MKLLLNEILHLKGKYFSGRNIFQDHLESNNKNFTGLNNISSNTLETAGDITATGGNLLFGTATERADRNDIYWCKETMNFNRHRFREILLLMKME